MSVVRCVRVQVQNFRYFDGSTELKELEHSQMGHTRLEEIGQGNATAGVARLWRCEREEHYTQLAGKTLVERVTWFFWYGFQYSMLRNHLTHD